MAISYGQFTLWVSVSYVVKSEPSCTSHKPRASYQRWLVRGDLQHEICPNAATQSYILTPCHCLNHLIVPSPWKLELMTLWEWIICLSIWHILIWRRLAQREGAIKILCIHSLLCRYQNWGTLLLFSHVQYIYNLENTDCGGLLITTYLVSSSPFLEIAGNKSAFWTMLLRLPLSVPVLRQKCQIYVLETSFKIF